MVAGGSAIVHSHCPTTTLRYYTSSEPKEQSNNNNDKSSPIFDLTKEWEQATTQGKEYFQKWIVTDDSKQDDEPTTTTTTSDSGKRNKEYPEFKLPNFLDGFLSTKKEDEQAIMQEESPHVEKQDTQQQKQQVSFASILKNVTSILLPGGTDESNQNSLQQLIEQARQSCDTKGDVRDVSSLVEMVNVMNRHRQELDDTLERTFGHLDLTRLFPTSMYYYIELEDSIKNPSWKRRMHRFHPGVDINYVQELMSALYLAELAYAGSLEEVQEGLARSNSPVELVYCDTESIPHEPAHFILLKKDQSVWSNELEVVIVVRGTRTVSDALTDAMMEAIDYRGGKTHEGILKSGRYLVGRHTELLQKLCQLAGKKKVKLTLVGHSLGAGAATIAAMEFNDHPMIEAKVVGFGCPSLLSKELAEQVKPFVTTVICDSDCIPRMNGVTIANKLLDIMEYDWIPDARRDILHALDELRRVAPLLVNESSTEYLMTTIDSWLDLYVKPTIQTPTTTNRAENILYPPGTCIHFYRDGVGVTATESPCTLFRELDVTRTMKDDHLVDAGYRRIFLQAMRQYTRDFHYSFEQDKYWK